MHLYITFAAWGSEWEMCVTAALLSHLHCSGSLAMGHHRSPQLSSAQARRGAAGFQSSSALHRDAEQSASEQVALFSALLGADQLFTTPLLPQELLQGFAGPKHRAQLVERLSALAFLQPVKDDQSRSRQARCLPPMGRQLRPGRIIRLACLGSTRTSS